MQICLTFSSGKAVDHEYTEMDLKRTGNTIVGTIDSRFEAREADAERVGHWLSTLAAAQPSLRLRFNGRKV